MNVYWILLNTFKKSSMKIIEWMTLTDFPIFNQPLCFLSLLVMKYHILNGGVGTYLLIHKVLSFVLVLAFNLPYFTFSSFCFFSENVFSFFWKWKWKYPTLQPHGLQHARPPCPSPSPETRSKSCPFSQQCHPTILLDCPFLFLPSVFPRIRLFLMNQLFASAGQSIGISASASVLPMNIQD